MPDIRSSKSDVGHSSFDDTAVEDGDDDLSQSEYEQPTALSRRCLLILGGMLTMPLILGVAYYLLFVYVPGASSSGSPSLLSSLPSGIHQSGPLVGHTTHNSSKIWFFHSNLSAMEIIYWHSYTETTANRTQRFFYGDGVFEAEKFFSMPQVVDLKPDIAEANGAAISTIQGLEANTKYQFEIRLRNESIAKGQFKTAPLPRTSTSQPSIVATLSTNDTNSKLQEKYGVSFTYLLASCMNVKSNTEGYMSQPVWDEVLSKNIDFALIPGDTVYMNYKDRDAEGSVKYHRVWYRHLQQRAESYFANFISKIPIYTTWDDHDYGKNDADQNQLGKESTLAAWGHLWPNPYQGSSKGVGNYYSFSWGDVDYFVMDCRWYRNNIDGTLFGSSQMEWLSEKLVASTATFKIIVSASDTMERGMSGDLKEIGAVVNKHSIPGVLFHSGDIHKNEFKMQSVKNWPYPVVQFTSSGIARVKQRPFAILTIDTRLEDPEILTQFYIADSNERNTTWSNNATSDCYEIRKVDDSLMKQRCSKVVRLSDLTPPPS